MFTSAILVVATVLAAEGDPGSSAAPLREAPAAPAGIAVLASSIGNEVPAKEIRALVRSCHLKRVVIDFAWITFHWPRTKLAEVERLAHGLRAEGVTVAAMYRPRGLSPQDAAIHWAKNADGTVSPNHVELCFAYPDSVRWGAEWGRKILEGCPSINQIVLYNVLARCQCERCREGQGVQHAEAFVRTCAEQWHKLRPGVQVGHVGVGGEYAASVDFLCPFLALNRSAKDVPVDTRTLTAQLTALKGTVPRPVVPLIKVCWEDETRNDAQDIVHALDDCRGAGLPCLLWYYEWIFRDAKQRYDLPAIRVALSGEDPEAEPSAAAPAGEYRFAAAYKDFPSAESRALGLPSLRREAALVYYSPTKKRLATQLAGVLEKMHGTARQIVGFPISVHGVVLLNSAEELPADKRSHWLNVDGVPCLVAYFAEPHLPLRTDVESHMAFTMLIHESVDMGIKETFLKRNPASLDWRWWLEGLADYSASEACRRHQPAAFRLSQQTFLKDIEAYPQPTIDVLDQAVWFPPGYKDPEDSGHAYAASLYLISQVAQRHGTDWVGKALRQYQAELERNPNPDFLAIVASLTGEDLHTTVHSIKTEEVRKFLQSLDRTPAAGRKPR